MPSRTVIQLQYLVWPDKSIPEEQWSLLAFRHRVRAHCSTSSTDGPLLVHCSAGVGRTGTFIALDMLLDELDSRDAVDVFDVVRRIRHQRMSAVQVKVISVSVSNKNFSVKSCLLLAHTD
jgi:cadherin 5 type 2 (VE-cadherin)